MKTRSGRIIQQSSSYVSRPSRVGRKRNSTSKGRVGVKPHASHNTHKKARSYSTTASHVAKQLHIPYRNAMKNQFTKYKHQLEKQRDGTMPMPTLVPVSNENLRKRKWDYLDSSASEMESESDSAPLYVNASKRPRPEPILPPDASFSRVPSMTRKRSRSNEPTSSLENELKRLHVGSSDPESDIHFYPRNPPQPEKKRFGPSSYITLKKKISPVKAKVKSDSASASESASESNEWWDV